MPPTILRKLALLVALAGGLSLQAAAQTSPEVSSSSDPPAAPASAEKSAPAKPSPGKKVWTNDDVEGLRGRAPVSAPGTPAAAAPAKNSLQDQRAREEYARKVQNYRKQLAPLYAELPRIDAELEQMHSFEDGSYRSTGGFSRVPFMPLDPADRINVLEKRKQEILGRISTIGDQARRDGILPGDLR